MPPVRTLVASLEGDAAVCRSITSVTFVGLPSESPTEAIAQVSQPGRFAFSAIIAISSNTDRMACAAQAARAYPRIVGGFFCLLLSTMQDKKDKLQDNALLTCG